PLAAREVASDDVTRARQERVLFHPRLDVPENDPSVFPRRDEMRAVCGESDREDGAFVAAERVAKRVAARDVEEQNGAFRRSGCDEPTVRAEAHGRQVRSALEGLSGRRLVADVPDLDQVLTVRRGEEGPVRREGHAANLLPLRAERLAEQLPVRDIPERDRPVDATGGERAIVGAERKVERE